jgi:hypothetical protein
MLVAPPIKKAASLVKANGLNTLSVLGEQGKDSSASAPAATEFVYFSQKGTPITDNLRVGAGYGRRPDSILRAVGNLTKRESLVHTASPLF